MQILRKELDPDQIRITTDLNSNLLVLAGPGSGKTKIITHRIAYLYRNKHVRPPSRVLSVTFTNKAAAEMRGRLRQLFKPVLTWTDIYTFHKFGEVILRNFGYLVGIRMDFVIYDDKLQAIALKAAAEKKGMKSFDAAASVEVIEYMKSEHGSIRKAAEALRESDKENLAELLEIYETIIHENNAVDFSDLLCVPLEIIRQNPSLKRVFQNMYEHVLVDECQDTNHVQLMLLRSLFENSDVRIFGVADEDQSIYTWRGARIKNLKDFLETFEADLRDLRRNYRCHPSILKVADSLILKSTSRMKTGELIACRRDDGECRAWRVDVPDIEAEGQFIADKISESMGNHIRKWSDVTVLGRNWIHLKPAAQALSEANIPNVVINEADIPDTPEVNVLLAALRSCANPLDSLGRDLVIQLLLEAEHPNPHSFDPAKFLKRTQNPLNLQRILRKSLNLDALLDDKEPDEKEKRLKAMNDFEAYCRTVFTTAPDLSSFSRSLTLEGHSDQAKEEDQENAVRLMTMHTSKGTENKVIFIVALDEEIFPRFNIKPNTEPWEEERRLLYVSITRAEDYLYLLHSETHPTTSGFLRGRNPSPLLLEIDHNLLSCMNYPE
jgi:DNA helicase-2/ATP-dependent DNA helicase PcrA